MAGRVVKAPKEKHGAASIWYTIGTKERKEVVYKVSFTHQSKMSRT
jgi:hypothetical protein